MHKSRGVAVALLIAISIFRPGLACAEQSLPLTFTNAQHGFRLSFPAGWAPMSPAKLEAANQLAESLHPDWKRPLFHYGYELTNSVGLAFQPSVVIRVAETTSAPEPLAILKEVEKGDSLPPGIHREEPRFDQSLNAVLQKNRFTTAGGAAGEADVAYFLKRASVIKMFLFAPLGTNAEAAVPISNIIQSVQIQEDLNLPPLASGSRTGLIVALLGMIVIILVLSRKKPTDSAQS